MNLQEFLSLIVPAGKLIAGKLVDRTNADGTPYKAFSHAVAGDHAALATQLVRMDRERLNAYFALASYQQGFHPKPAEPDKKQLRVRTNVAMLKALWFDIDFKPDPKTGVAIYPDMKTGLLALKVFCQTIQLAFPSSVVGSGNGFHAYWVFAEAITLDRWQRLADALKAAAFDKGLVIDPTCTADACRVLRPPGTSNWKDPANPKPVKILYTSGEQFTYEALEAILTPWIGAVRRSVTPNTSAKVVGGYDELTGGLQSSQPSTAEFEVITKNCGVARMLAETHGKSAPEPLWTASLQLLKFCTDAEFWVHPISDGHPGYDAEATRLKWEQRKANTAGPTLCKTFAGWEPNICAKCPYSGHISTPLEVGHEQVQPVNEMLQGWRIADDRKGMERLMIDDTTKEKSWVKVLSYVYNNVKVARSHSTRAYGLTFDFEINGTTLGHMELPSSTLGNPRKLAEMLADNGAPLINDQEMKAFRSYMSTWLKKLQSARLVSGGTEKLGWVIERTDQGDKLVGFAAGIKTFYADGRSADDIRAGRDYTNVAKLYEPKGGLDQWKKVAGFLAEQNKGAFIAILSAAFATPLLRFTGLSGAILSIVSTASGVGKSSALKCSQAVWGSPTHGVNAVNDTAMSVAKKLGFLNSLPAYWDELRGQKALEEFLTLAFQVTQGKERTRLDSSANLKEVSTWETMLVVASNESIFDAMARHGAGSDAGMVRTFEMNLEHFKTDRNKAELAMMFETLNGNFGHAGQVYAQYLATNVPAIEQRVQSMYTSLATKLDMQPQERFWFSILTALMVGAELAVKLDLVKFDMRQLGVFLLANLERLRQRSEQAMALKGPAEILAAFMAQFQDSAVIVDRFLKPRENSRSYLPDLTGGIPRSDKMKYQVSRTESLLRVSQAEFTNWLEWRHLPVSGTLNRLTREYSVRKFHGVLGIGTKWNTIPQHLFEFDLAKFGLPPFITGVPSSLAGNSGLRAPTAPAGSSPSSSPP